MYCVTTNVEIRFSNNVNISYIFEAAYNICMRAKCI